MRLSVRFGLAALAVMLLGAAQDAKAIFSPSLASVSGPVAGVYTYAYTIRFGNTTALDYSVTPGAALPPATGGTPITNRGTADFVTIYDIGGFVSASVAPAFAAKYSVVTQAIGINGPLTAPVDDPFGTNVTVRYIGAGTTADFTDVGAILINSTNALTQPGTYTSQFTNVPAPNDKVGEISTVQVPGIPEPSSIALVGMGLAGLFGYGYRRRRQG